MTPSRTLTGFSASFLSSDISVLLDSGYANGDRGTRSHASYHSDFLRGMNDAVQVGVDGLVNTRD
jgi:hypothetical protein